MASTSALRAARWSRTHDAIADAAARLFAVRGFEAVTIDQVAKAAGVGRQTVFNHFAVKEDLVFDEFAERRDALVAAVTRRPAGVSAAAAVRDWTLARWRTVRTAPDDGRPDSGIFLLVHSTPALQARQRELAAHTVRALEPALAYDNALTARVVATALVAVDQAVFEAVAERVSRGERVEDVLPDILAAAADTYDTLVDGLAGQHPASA